MDEELAIRVPVSAAKAQLTDLVRRAEAGDEVILTRHGQASVRLVPVHDVPTRERRRADLERIRAMGTAQPSEGPSTARSQDFLDDEDGLPG